MTTRAHISKPILDAAGNVRTGVSVRVLQPGTTTDLGATLYSADQGSASRTNPFVAGNGIVDFYLDAPTRVRLGVTVGQEGETFFEDVDIILPFDVSSGGGGFHAGTGLHSIIGGDIYGLADGFNPSQATGSDSLAIGSQSVADGQQAIAIGNNATATGSQSQAEGESAIAFGNQAIAYGNSATAGDDSLPLGDAKNNQPQAMGNTAQAIGSQTLAVGNTASSYGQQGTAVGNSSSVTGNGGTAVGDSATAGSGYQRSHADDTFGNTAIGNSVLASGNQDTVVGAYSVTRAGGQDNTVVGADSAAQQGSNPVSKSTVVGANAYANANRAIALGEGANPTVDDHGVVKIDALELVPSSPGGIETALILRDSAGVRWKITVDTTGHLTTTAL